MPTSCGEKSETDSKKSFLQKPLRHHISSCLFQTHIFSRGCGHESVTQKKTTEKSRSFNYSMAKWIQIPFLTFWRTSGTSEDRPSADPRKPTSQEILEKSIDWHVGFFHWFCPNVFKTPKKTRVKKILGWCHDMFLHRWGVISQVYEVVMWSWSSWVPNIAKILEEELAGVETLNNPLVGGFNPFERYCISQDGNLPPNRGW